MIDLVIVLVGIYRLKNSSCTCDIVKNDMKCSFKVSKKKYLGFSVFFVRYLKEFGDVSQ